MSSLTPSCTLHPPLHPVSSSPRDEMHVVLICTTRPENKIISWLPDLQKFDQLSTLQTRYNISNLRKISRQLLLMTPFHTWKNFLGDRYCASMIKWTFVNSCSDLHVDGQPEAVFPLSAYSPCFDHRACFLMSDICCKLLVSRCQIEYSPPPSLFTCVPSVVGPCFRATRLLGRRTAGRGNWSRTKAPIHPNQISMKNLITSRESRGNGQEEKRGLVDDRWMTSGWPATGVFRDQSRNVYWK